MTRQYVTSPYAEGAARPPAGPAAQAPPPRVPVGAQVLVLGSAAATTVLLAAAGIIATVEAEALRAWWRGPELENGTVDLLNTLGALTAVTNVVAFVATGVWLLGLRAVAESASPDRPHRRAGYWAFLGWVVPVVNLWFPLQVVEDAGRGVGSSMRTYLPWWIAWLALLGYVVLGGSGGVLASEGDVDGWIRAQQATALLAVNAGVLWWRVVRSASVAAAAAAAGGGPR